jgi:CheY-like chemotaxis protein
MTANAFDEDVEKSRAAGMNAHLSKPIDPDLMYGTLYQRGDPLSAENPRAALQIPSHKKRG